MREREYRLHILAGCFYGKESACGSKIRHSSGPAVVALAEKLSTKDKRLEAYPCFWCPGWHIGRAMEEKERAPFYRIIDEFMPVHE